MTKKEFFKRHFFKCKRTKWFLIIEVLVIFLFFFREKVPEYGINYRSARISVHLWMSIGRVGSWIFSRDRILNKIENFVELFLGRPNLFELSQIIMKTPFRPNFLRRWQIFGKMLDENSLVGRFWKILRV